MPTHYLFPNLLRSSTLSDNLYMKTGCVLAQHFIVLPASRRTSTYIIRLRLLHRATRCCTNRPTAHAAVNHPADIKLLSATVLSFMYPSLAETLPRSKLLSLSNQTISCLLTHLLFFGFIFGRWCFATLRLFSHL